MASRRRRHHPGFTLIELLVAIAVIALLIGLLLPVLSRSRDAAVDLKCTAHLQKMMQGWEVLMFERRGNIPNTVNVTDTAFVSGVGVVAAPNRPRWDPELQAVLDTPAILDLGPTGSVRNAATICPEIEQRFSGPLHSTPFFGYSVNGRLRSNNTGSLIFGDNENTDWYSLHRPAQYPWFTDPFIQQGSTSAFALGDTFGVTPPNDWRMGFYHSQDTNRTAFADGHVEPITREVLQGPTDGFGTPLWFLDVP